MKTITLMLMIFGFAASAEARLGESVAKIAERYGRPLQTFRDIKGRASYIYHYAGYMIMVRYHRRRK